MRNKELISRMKTCVSGKLPAGIIDQNVEFFAKGESVFAIVQSQMLPPAEWPNWLKESILQDMQKHPSAVQALVDADFVTEEEMVVQYIKCRYSALDNQPDMIEGRLQDTEYVDCSLRGSCPFEGRLCELLAARYGILTPREIEVLKLIPEGLLDKEIADKMGISVLTVGVYMKNLREKTGYKNKAELVRFAFEKNLI
ncbi:response regulator transcription factor [Cyclobacterium salsum]|uniref:response regulator transcription factor n=1 Tax=Cyclobacterium salsum TaxID=2666329 RepID=UPI001391AEF1|nr:helix-turn-helix transcriptional regulator [Cyclobacterium salsum]